ncbi:uncharacterized protein LOC112001670 [Quercus suber]|nr:uncharacterized protein LOC112001670 isoform X1 [Quercus suber]XP_023889623.1 uncharacterized protein LOC112001670 isoform X1 [Quercus suber]XP_023889631.1 uncharacterized protein LOC112001670 isoform X2 [Quercus suber]POF21802.1 uncharacterized protein CFP56_49035 [Quercus suber]
MAMDLTSPKYFQAQSMFASNGEPPLEGNTSFYGKSNDNPFVDTFPDPLCKLNLKETSDFVKSFPMANNVTEGRGFLEVSAQRKRDGVNSVTSQRRLEAPSTPGRPVFSFSTVGNHSRKSFPSKWDDAEKWLMSSSCHDSPAHNNIKPSDSSKLIKQYCDNFKQQVDIFAEKSRVTEEKVSKVVSSFQGSAAASLDQHNSFTALNGTSTSTDVLLKDKFTDDIEAILPNFRYSEPTKEGFLFKNSAGATMKDACTDVVHEVHHRDIGTEMTPLGSSTTSRCPTPFKSSSPARHNTPANRSGPLTLENSSSSTNSTIDISQLQECHLAKLQLGNQYDSVTSNWSSREEEEEQVSKSLRHFEEDNGCRKSVSDSRAAAWEEEEKTKCCLRYQREEAKIQAWVNLQNAKAEAQSRKLEVKIQRMKSNLEEKLMKRMAIVHRKAEEWRAAAQQQHSEQIEKASEQARKIISRHNSYFSGHSSCGCFPCNNHY